MSRIKIALVDAMSGNRFFLPIAVVAAYFLAGCPLSAIQVLSTQPANDDTLVSTISQLVVTFDAAILPESFEGDSEPGFDFASAWSADGRTLTLTPSESLLVETAYTFTIDWAESEDGELEVPYVFGFTTGSGAQQAQPMNLADVQYWGYQIQGICDAGAADALVNSDYDMLVIEPSRTDWSYEAGVDTCEARLFDTAGLVSRIKSSKASDGAHRKLAIAYIDIGQAEDWRWYWRGGGWTIEECDDSGCTGPLPADWPSWIVARDPDGWGGNYPVAFWDSDWKDLVIYGQDTGTHPDRDYGSILDEVIRDGFDGIYLDWVEAFEDAQVIAAAEEAQITDIAQEMIDFIAEMRVYAEQRNPDFIIIQQNAASLIHGGDLNPVDHPELLDAIDAIAQEGIWFEGVATDEWDEADGKDLVVDADITEAYIEDLDRYLANGIPVFACEYALDSAPQGYANAAGKGYIPYCTRRSLGQLTTTPPEGIAAGR
jgi:cysteinyl-tRNA synthetase, unknown class